MNKAFKYLLITATSILFLNLLTVNPVKAETTPLPVIKGTIAITIDMDTREIIYAKNGDIIAQPASTTKLMTALLLAENKEKSDCLPFTKNAKAQPSSSIYTDFLPSLKVGDTFTADNIMKALLLSSANDMAYVISDAIDENTSNFATMMNEKSKMLGMYNTNFVTPSGLDNNTILAGKTHYSTAYDLALLGIFAYRNPWIKETLTLKDNIKISTTSGLNSLIKNTNKNLGIGGCIGGKTGFTDKAGRCFIAMYERNGRRIIGVVLNSILDSSDTIVFKDMLNLINYSYSVQKTNLYTADSEVSKKTISFKPFKYLGVEKEYEIPIIVKEDVTQYSNEINNAETKAEVRLNDIDSWLLDKNIIMGTFTVKERTITKTYNLYTTTTTNDLIKANSSLYSICVLLLFIFLTLLISTVTLIIIFKLCKRSKKSKKYKNSSNSKIKSKRKIKNT